jgi:creatinine amidohydrolase
MLAREARMRALAECTTEDVRRLARRRDALVLLPLGAIEQHGPHLPLAVDWLGAEALARAVAPHLERAGYRCVLAPSLPYGASPLAADWSGTVSLRAGTLCRVVVEILEGLAGHGFARFVLVNYQADPGHLAAMAAIKRTVERRRGRRVLFAGFAPTPSPAMFDPRVRALLRSPRPELEWHSGELETAVMLAVAPRLVRHAVARRLPASWVDWRAALRRGTTFRRMHPRGRGYFGAPAVARADTGRRALRLRGRLIAAELVAALQAPRR